MTVYKACEIAKERGITTLGEIMKYLLDNPAEFFPIEKRTNELFELLGEAVPYERWTPIDEILNK